MKDFEFRSRFMRHGFSPMPKAVLKSPKLSMQAKSLYCQLVDYAWYGQAFPGRERLAHENGVHPNSIDSYMKELRQLGLVTVTRRGLGLTNLYMIEDLSDDVISKLTPYCNTDSQSDVIQESHSIVNKEEVVEEKTVSIIPTHVRTIVEHLNRQVGKKYSSKTATTIKLIKARFNEGYTIDDFITVIDNMTREWLHDEKMCKFLTPDTLFSNKFDKYLNRTTPKKSPLPSTHDFLNQYGYTKG